MRDFIAGIRMFGRGFAIVFRSPRLLLIGAIPAVITTVLLLSGVAALVYWIGDITSWMTPFADDWSTGLRQGIRVLAGITVVGAAVAIGVVTFTALTLLVGGPFYEYIAEAVEDLLAGSSRVTEDQLGGVPDGSRSSWLGMLVRGMRDSFLLVLLSVVLTLPLFFAGFIPVVGQTVVPVLVTCVGAWLLAMELVGVPFQRRGLRLGDRHRVLRWRRALTLGLGVPAYLLCAIPFVAIVVMPAAVVGGTLLARETLTHPDRVRASNDQAPPRMPIPPRFLQASALRAVLHAWAMSSHWEIWQTKQWVAAMSREAQ